MQQLNLELKLIKRPANRRARLIALGLGLSKIHQTRVLQDNPCIRGMIFKIQHLIEIISEPSATNAKKLVKN